MGRFIYNLLMPIVFLFVLPGLIKKYISRGGWKSTFGERFALFGNRREELAKFKGAIWIHAVSVGETIVALSLIRSYLAAFPERKFILSTTTTTGQEVARKKCPENCAVIFCPIDFPWMVRRTLKLLAPSMLVIFETEIWPNLISIAARRSIPVALVNARLSDHSATGYRRLRIFFDPLLRKFDLIMAQSDTDAERFKSISPKAKVMNAGNLKFDQEPPQLPEGNELSRYLGNEPGPLILLAASTHPGEELLTVRCFKELRAEFPNLKLVIVPRHAERGADIAEMLKNEGVDFIRKSIHPAPDTTVDVLLADTTGEMLKLMKDADVVLMGKSFAGHDEGHNLIEPALLAKPIVTGPKLRNFRYILNVLFNAGAVVTSGDDELTATLRKLFADENYRKELGMRAFEVIGSNRGASAKIIAELEKLTPGHKD